jgi:CRP-like cAMP-binding protein
LDDEHIGSLVRIANCRTVPAETRLTIEGRDHPLAMYLILDGKVEVRREGHAIANLGPGENFGEMALLVPDLPRSADVVAMSETTVLQLTAWDFAPIIKGHPEVALAVIEQLARRLIASDHRLVEAYGTRG